MELNEAILSQLSRFSPAQLLLDHEFHFQSEDWKHRGWVSRTCRRRLWMESGRRTSRCWRQKQEPTTTMVVPMKTRCLISISSVHQFIDYCQNYLDFCKNDADDSLSQPESLTQVAANVWSWFKHLHPHPRHPQYLQQQHL